MIKGTQICLGLAVVLALALGAAVWATPRAPQLPEPGVIDQVVHDRGNIVTTVQNFGYVGGYSWAGRPSGRWPANTTHDYLAEMKFWIGGVNAAGDTLLANTDDDFTPIPSWISGSLSHDIRLSTDSARYDYDPADTIGAGIGHPAYGWRVWDPQLEEWDYSQVFSFVDSTFHDGGPLGVQEAITRFADDALGFPVMGLEITQTSRQWNYEYNKDMIFFNLEIKNASLNDYHDVAIGLYLDFDVGGPDPVSGDNGRLGDLVACDTALDLAWTYDEDGFDPGWGPTVVAGVMGTVILSTPDDVGMTSFNTGQWEFLPQTDGERFAMIDNTDFDGSLPPTDQYYIQSVRGLSLPAGQTVTFNFALVAAPNAEYLQETARRAKVLYESYYIGATPPTAPTVKATPGDGCIKLYWDDAAENSIEMTTGIKDFKGYKLYRSSDRGLTWGTKITNPDYSVGPDYYPIAIYVIDELSRINRSFVDSGLTNGVEYWYSVAAFDSGSEAYGVLQNDRGGPGTNTNTVSVIPRDDPLGYRTPQQTMTHLYAGDWKPSQDAVTIYVVDEGMVTGDQYRVSFTEDCVGLLWNLINTTTGDTVLVDQDKVDGFRNSPVVDGIQIIVKNPARVPDTIYQSQFAVPDQTSLGVLFFQEFAEGVGCNVHFRNDIEVRFTATGSTAYDWFSGAQIHLPFEIWNLTSNAQVGCWIADWATDGEWTPGDVDYIILTNYDYDNGNFHPEVLPDYLTWLTALDPASTPADGDAILIEGPRLFSPDDQFDFASRTIVAADASSSLNKIRVVPNPYLGRAGWEASLGERKLQFSNLPDQCTIRIYTLAGEMVRTIDHESGSGTEDWDMVSEAGRGIASGVYLYNIESPYGNFTGKFAVIK